MFHFKFHRRLFIKSSVTLTLGSLLGFKSPDLFGKAELKAANYQDCERSNINTILKAYGGEFGPVKAGPGSMGD